MSASFWLSCVAVALIVDVILSHRGLAKAVRNRQRPYPRATHYPSISVIRPVRGADVDAKENFTAALDTGYPGDVETLFVFDDEHDAGLPIARAVLEAHRETGRPGRADVLVAGPPPNRRTGKLNAMIHGLRHARGALVAFGDSDTRPDAEVLRETVDALLTTPGAGAAFPPVVARGGLTAAGDAGYALLINAWYGPAVSRAASADGTMPFIMGQLMVFTRQALDAIGGLECAEGQLVDDMFLGKRIVAAGYRNVVAARPLTIVNNGMSLGRFVQVFRRWIIFSRSGLPFAFIQPLWRQGLHFFVALLGAVGAAAAGAWTAAALSVLALLVYRWSMTRLFRDFSGESLAPKYRFMVWLLALISPWVFISSVLRRRVEWRGRVYGLALNAELNARPAPRATTRPMTN
ncbi:MAG: glycosyltransferase [Myxococcaceae bacterium]